MPRKLYEMGAETLQELSHKNHFSQNSDMGIDFMSIEDAEASGIVKKGSGPRGPFWELGVETQKIVFPKIMIWVSI